MKAVIDTNILVDYLNGVDAARRELALYEEPSISVITWIEVLVGAQDDEEPVLRDFLLRFHVISVRREIGDIAMEIRRERRIRLPDAIIWATARYPGMILVTRNTRYFPADHPGVRVPYEV